MRLSEKSGNDNLVLLQSRKSFILHYNYLKQRKKKNHARKERILITIQEIYHAHNGIDGYRSMKIYLERKGIVISNQTVHRYMNRELGLTSVVRRKKPEYRKGKAHKVFENLIKQDFYAPIANQKWCIDFTYLFLSDGEVRYNCSILDLHDRSIVASLTDRHITADLAIRTVRKALTSQPAIKGKIILHSDQGSQFTSKEFVDFCASVGIVQSMSKAGYPYDNAPMERYYNTLKNEMINQYAFRTEAELYGAVDEFAYVTYNHVRPHAFNNYMTPFAARYARTN